MYHEMEVLLEMFFVGGTYDQLNLPSLASFEVAARRLQSIVDAHAGEHPNWGSARLFSGVTSAEDIVMPELRHEVAKKAKEEAEVEAMRSKGRSAAVLEAVGAGGLPGKGAAGGKGKAKGGKSKAELAAPEGG